MAHTLSRGQVRPKRLQLKLTQAELADLSGLDPAIISRVERDANVTRATLEKIAIGFSKAMPRLSGAAIRVRRRKLKLTQQQLADAAGYCGRTVWQIEANQCRARNDTLGELNKALSTFEQEPAAGLTIRARREAAALTQPELARQAEVSLCTVLATEKGYRRPRPGTLDRLTAVLDTTEATMPPADLKRMRILLRMTQEDIAKVARVSVATIVGIEHDVRRPTPAIRRALHSAMQQVAVSRGTTLQAMLDVREPAVSGQEIRRRRLAAGISQADLARRAGVSQQSLWFIEQDRFKPRPRTLRAIERELAKGPTSEPARSARLFPKATKGAKRRWSTETGAAREGAGPHPQPARTPEPSAHPTSDARRIHNLAGKLEDNDRDLVLVLFRAEACAAKPSWTSDLVNLLEVSERTFDRIVRRLKGLRVVVTRGRGRGGLWLSPSGVEVAQFLLA